MVLTLKLVHLILICQRTFADISIFNDEVINKNEIIIFDIFGAPFSFKSYRE